MMTSTHTVVAFAPDAIDPKDVTPATDDDGTLRMIDGAPVYLLRGVMVRDADGRTIKSSTVRVRTAPTTPIPPLTALRCVDCMLTPWVRDGRVALSVLADHVEIAAPNAARHQAVDHE